MRLPLFFRRTDEHVVDRDRVGCPLRGSDVDVETCAACGWASAIDLRADPPVVRCRPSPITPWWSGTR
jgi:hypothetical protein